jgi:hypothetical protein
VAGIQVPVDESMFDDDPNENSPIDGRASKNADAAIKERAAALDFDLCRGAVPTFVTVPPRIKIDIDERAAALAENSLFLCLGHNGGDYFFRSKRSGELTVIRDFEEQRIYALAPLAFWKAWSGTEDVEWRAIVDALIQLAYRTGQYKQQF